MKSIQLNKKASTTIAVVLIIVSISTGAIVTGTILAKNDKTFTNDFITFQDAIDIASAIPEVATFIEENDITSISANKYDNIWTVEFYTDDIDYSEDYYCWMNFAYVEIDAETGEVLYFIVYSSSEPNYTEEEVIAIANAIPDIAEWLELQPDAFISVWYDGYGYWCIDYYSDLSFSYAFVIVSDYDGSVVYYEIYDPFEGALHTEEEILDIVEALSVVQSWIAANPGYERYIYFFDTVWYGDFSIENQINDQKVSNLGTTPEITNINITGGVWIVDYWFYNDTDYKWLSVTVDDTTGEVIDILQEIEPTLSESEALSIASSIPEVADFLANMTSYSTYIWFDSYNGIWTVSFEDEFNIYKYAVVDILDATSEILYYYISDIPETNLSGEEALAIALALPEVQDWLAINTNYSTFIGYYEGYWEIDFFMDNATIVYEQTPTATIVGMFVIIDDLTGEVVEVGYIEIATIQI